MNLRHLQALFSCTVLAVAVHSQVPSTKKAAPALPSLPNDANQYFREVIQHELAEQDSDHTLWRYRLHKEGKDKKDNKNYSYDRDVIETKEGVISRTVLWNGQPLTPEVRLEDDKRMRQILTDPAVLAKNAKRTKNDTERVRKLLGAGPDAFNFQYDGEEQGLVRLRFRPNPHYDAPDHELRLLRSLSGKVWIDRASSRLARIEGALLEDVTFVLRILGRVNKGSTVKVIRQDIGSGHWDFVSFDINASGHGIIYASLSLRGQEFSNYTRMPDNLSLSQAYELLRKDSDAKHSAISTQH